MLFFHPKEGRWEPYIKYIEKTWFRKKLPHIMGQQGSHCYGSLKWLSGNYDSKVNYVGQLDTEKLTALVSLYVWVPSIPLRRSLRRRRKIRQNKVLKTFGVLRNYFKFLLWIWPFLILSSVWDKVTTYAQWQQAWMLSVSSGPAWQRPQQCISQCRKSFKWVSDSMNTSVSQPVGS